MSIITLLILLVASLLLCYLIAALLFPEKF